jgi:hypothetical protein
MKKQLLIGLLLLGTLAVGRAGIYYQGTGVTGDTQVGTMQNTTIVDGNPAMLTVNTMDLSGQTLSSPFTVTVSLNITGGNNSGLYAYLVNGSTTVTLMNQPGVGVGGFGATGPGMNITLSDAGSSSIQNATGNSALSGTYSAAGSLLNFSGGNPSSPWTLYFADTIAGGGNATLTGWSLDIEAVPEPVNVALGIFGGLMGLLALARSQMVKAKFKF